jgi:type IV pilus biogenesis protein PilP
MSLVFAHFAWAEGADDIIQDHLQSQNEINQLKHQLEVTKIRNEIAKLEKEMGVSTSRKPREKSQQAKLMPPGTTMESIKGLLLKQKQQYQESSKPEPVSSVYVEPPKLTAIHGLNAIFRTKSGRVITAHRNTRLPTGHQVTSIKPTGVVLQRNKSHIHMPLHWD